MRFRVAVLVTAESAHVADNPLAVLVCRHASAMLEPVVTKGYIDESGEGNDKWYAAWSYTFDFDESDRGYSAYFYPDEPEAVYVDRRGWNDPPVAPWWRRASRDLTSRLSTVISVPMPVVRLTFTSNGAACGGRSYTEGGRGWEDSACEFASTDPA
jgi:hypothetical protein